MGGGRAKFLPQSSGGERLDGKDLVAAWRQDKAGIGQTRYVTSREELMAAETSDTDYLLGEVFNTHQIDVFVFNCFLLKVLFSKISFFVWNNCTRIHVYSHFN